jgi:putative acetyltransferase
MSTTHTSYARVEIKIDDLSGSEIAGLLTDHLRCLAEVSPPESRHALNLDELRAPEVTFWSAWQGQELAGCGALKELDPAHGEIKSMRTARAHLRKGVASLLLEHIVSEARRRAYRRLSLETGSMAYFEPARRLYRKFGFRLCPPFADYREDPNSVFMTQELVSSTVNHRPNDANRAMRRETSRGTDFGDFQ